MDGPLAGEMWAGKLGGRLYVARKAEGSRELRVLAFDTWRHLEEIDFGEYPIVLGFYSLEEVGPGDAVWGWTDFGRPWYSAAGFTCDGGPLKGQTYPGELGDHIVCVQSPADGGPVGTVRLSGQTASQLSAYLAPFREERGDARLLGYYTLEPVEGGESVWRWTDLRELRRSTR